MNMKTRIVYTVLVCLLVFFLTSLIPKQKPALNNERKAQLGKLLFFDATLSSTQMVSCASCHKPNLAFADDVSFSQGVLNRTGNRNTPTLNYVAFTPSFYHDTAENTYLGGFFVDGRAAQLEQQILGPLFHPNEMNLTNKTGLVNAFRSSNYLPIYTQVFGTINWGDTNRLTNNIVEAISAYLKTNEVSPFTSKFDFYMKGLASFTEQEKLGLTLFNDSLKGNCASCHPSTPNPLTQQVLFTDYTYDNLGVPANKTTKGAIDLGLGTTTGRSEDYGKFKVPTLRNVALTAPYFHNGSFMSLKQVVDFYNRRDSRVFGYPEVAANVNTDELGNLGLTQQECDAIVAFLHTLTDGYNPAVTRK